MAEVIDLTEAVPTLLVSLTRGSDFERQMTPEEGETFDEAMELILDFGVDEWPAEVTSESATWSVDAADSDVLFDLAPSTCVLRYKSGEADRVWAMGPVILYG